MPTYTYTGLDAWGRPTEGRVVAISEEAARFQLDRDQITVETLRTPWWGREFGARRVKKETVTVFTELMASLLASHLKPREALEVLRDEMPGTAIRRTLYDLSISIERGRAFSEATREHPRAFPPVYSAAIEAAESAGALQRIMKQLAHGMRKTEQTRKKITGALIYPAIILALVSIVGGGLLYFVVPQFAEMITESGGELPILTRLLLGASAVTRAYGPIVFAMLIGATVALRIGLRRSPAVRQAVDATLIRIPILKDLLIAGAMANFARLFSILHASRTNVVDSIHLAANTVSNSDIRRRLHETAEGHASGRPLSEEMRRVGVVPPIMTAMTTVGERSGNLAEMMNTAAEFYDEYVDHQVGRLNSILAPLAIALTFIPVIVLVLGIYVPMISAIRSMG
jgi:type IV pilus assembly protein PilC